MADLFATLLRPVAEQRGLETWEQLAAYAAEAGPSGAFLAKIRPSRRIGGMFSSTVLTLVVIPAVYTVFADAAAAMRRKKSPSEENVAPEKPELVESA
ncbi:MAG: hypothetical protein ABI680_04055 [Chthoniobacteraceae bacterium]